MALDVYVMPLWRFKVGDFCSPIETATGIRPKIVTAEGILDTTRKPGWFARWRAKREVAAIRKAVEVANRTPIHWVDQGAVVYAEQSRGFESLRAYAKWLDCREELSEFGPAPDNNYYEHPVWKVKGGTPSNPHLVAHDCFCGYYLPCDFDQMAMVEPYMIFGRWPASRSVGSTPRLLRALDRLRPELGDEYPPDDPLLPVKAAFRQLQQVAELSVEYALPIIFWG